MIRRILTQDEEFSVLRKPCNLIEEVTQDIRDLVDDMWETMYANHGVGLAAPQIGVSLRVAVVDTAQRAGSYRKLVLVNPAFGQRRGEQTADEGCLSMPGLRWPITRPFSINVLFCGLDGIPRTMPARGLLARAIQHECDHLNGVLCNSLAPVASKVQV